MDIIDLTGMPVPPIGGKVYLIQTKGLFIFERGPGTFRTLACTHAGSGGFIGYDGVPDENGIFPDEGMEPSHPGYGQANGRVIYKANPAVMGSWMCDAGFYHGFAIRASGGHRNAPAFGTVVWMPFRQRSR